MVCVLDPWCCHRHLPGYLATSLVALVSGDDDEKEEKDFKCWGGTGQSRISAHLIFAKIVSSHCYGSCNSYVYKVFIF